MTFFRTSHIVTLLLIFCGLPAVAATKHHEDAASQAQAVDPGFEQWLVQFKQEARTQGITDATLQAAFDGVQPLERVVQLDRKQPEKKLTLEEYLAKVISDARIRQGRELLAEHKELLSTIEREYQVPAAVIVALWGIETSYGNNTGSFDLIEALSTLAFDGRRSAYFRGELLNALRILQAEHITREEFQGSWAGAMGQCQFMPTSFLRYAVDYDRDGHRDIWNTEADVFASIANYLQQEGWQMGGEIVEGSHNFSVILRWNRSRYFATAVGQLVAGFNEPQQ
jgi:membrane-bound lytic murein transglycosylase B